MRSRNGDRDGAVAVRRQGRDGAIVSLPGPAMVPTQAQTEGSAYANAAQIEAPPQREGLSRGPGGARPRPGAAVRDRGQRSRFDSF